MSLNLSNKVLIVSKGWEKPVPAAAVIPVAQMMIYTGFKTWEAGLSYFYNLSYYDLKLCYNVGKRHLKV